MSTGPNALLAVVGRSDHGRPSTYRLQRAHARAKARRDAAYRRLAVTILGVDVLSLAVGLRSRRSVPFIRADSAA